MDKIFILISICTLCLAKIQVDFSDFELTGEKEKGRYSLSAFLAVNKTHLSFWLQRAFVYLSFYQRGLLLRLMVDHHAVFKNE